MKKFIIISLIFLNISSALAYSTGPTRPYDNNWYIRSNKSEYANRDRKTFDPPPVGTQAKKLNKLQRILYSSNRKHPSQWYRYDTHISGREYVNCSYYKYVDCADFTFCRCWQCRDYVYPITRVEY